MTASQTPQQLTISSCIFFLAMFWFTPVAAESFFTGYVKVKDQERSTYKKASASAFLQVLNKSTGKNNKELLSHHSIQASAENAYKLVQQFSYEKDIAALTDTTYLVATFNQKNIRQVLQDANLKMLLAHRPSIAVIAVTQYKGTLRVLRPNRPVLDADYGDLLRTAKANGVMSVEVPTKTLKGLSAKKLWYFNQDYIDAMGKQLKVENIIIIRLAHTSNGRWVGGSTFSSLSAAGGDTPSNKEVSDKTFTGALAPLFRQVNDYWLEQYAIRLNQSQNEVVVQVSGVDDFADFKQLTDELENLPVVSQVYVLQAKGSVLTVSVALESDFPAFIKHVKGVNNLRPVSNSTTDTADVNVGQSLRYQWRK